MWIWVAFGLISVGFGLISARSGLALFHLLLRRFLHILASDRKSQNLLGPPRTSWEVLGLPAWDAQGEIELLGKASLSLLGFCERQA